MAVDANTIRDFYRNILGRSDDQISDSEIAGWENAPDASSVEAMFRGSPEYAAKNNTQATWQDVGGQITPVNPPSGGGGDNSPYQIQGYGDSGPQRAGSSASSDFNPTTADWNRLHGFAASNYYDPNMNSMKYMFARIAADYDPSQPGALDRIVSDPRFRAAFPNARIVGKDSIDFGGQLSDGSRGVPVGLVDVGESFFDNRGGRAWQWLDQGNGGGGTSTSGPTRPPVAGGGGNSGGGTLGDLRQLYGQLGQQYGGPGGPGITNGPLQQVGQDPLSFLITGALADFIGRGGSTAFGQDVQSALLDIINGGNNPNINRRFESARELMAKGQRTMMNDTRAELANRGLLSEPGIPQGAEIGAVKRVEESLAPEFSRALRDIYTEETSSALQQATGMAADQARTFLAGIGEGTNRQTALANIALQSLSQNMAWSQFLAEFGLKRDQVLQQLQNGRIDDVMQLLNTFLSLTSLSRGGYV